MSVALCSDGHVLHATRELARLDWTQRLKMTFSDRGTRRVDCLHVINMDRPVQGRSAARLLYDWKRSQEHNLRPGSALLLLTSNHARAQVAVLRAADLGLEPNYWHVGAQSLPPVVPLEPVELRAWRV